MKNELQRVTPSAGIRPFAEDFPSPRDLDAECSILKTIMAFPEVIREVATIMPAEHFFDCWNREVFCAIVAVNADGVTPDIPMVAKRLMEAGVLDRGDKARFAAMFEDHGSAANIKHYVADVTAAWQQREGIRVAEDVAIQLRGLGRSPRKMLRNILERGEEEFRRIAATAQTPPKPARLERFKPFPVDVLPQPLRRFVANGAKSIGCDPSYLALPLLVEMAAAIGATRRIRLKRGWEAPAILWGAIVGESGTSKTPAFELVMRPIRERQRLAYDRHAQAMAEYQTNLTRFEKELSDWKRGDGKKRDAPPPEKPQEPQAERYIVSDTTVEALAPLLQANPRGLLLARDELAGWLGSFDRYTNKGGVDSANWLSMFNGVGITVDRKSGDHRQIFVPNPAISLCGGIQPAILSRALGSEHRESGLAARLLLTCPPRVAKHWTEADIDPAEEDEIAFVVDQLYKLQPIIDDNGRERPQVIELSSEAKGVWTKYYNEHAQEQANLAGDLSAAWSKLEEYPARLALVIHCVRCAASDPKKLNPDAVDEVSMKSGIRLANWFKGEARRVYGMLEENKCDRDQRRLLEWIDQRGGAVTVRQVQSGCAWLKAPGAAESALSKLTKVNLGSWQNRPTTSKGGRPSRHLVLSAASEISETSSMQGKTDVSLTPIPLTASETEIPEKEW